jgi:hypothetical protein
MLNPGAEWYRDFCFMPHPMGWARSLCIGRVRPKSLPSRHWQENHKTGK